MLAKKGFFNQTTVVNNFFIWLKKKKKNEKKGFSQRRAIHCGSTDSLSFKTSFTAKFFDIKRKLFYFFIWIKLIFIWKVLQLALLWKWGFLELYNGVLYLNFLVIQ